MDRTILTGPSVLPTHASPLLFSKFRRVFHEKENEFTTDPSKLTEEQFRSTVLKGVKDSGDKTSTLVTEHKTLKDQAEKAFKDLADVTKSAQEQAAKIIALEKSLVAAQRNFDPREDVKEWLKRAYPDECKHVGEMIRKGERSFSLVQRAESTTTQPAIVPQEFSNVIYSRVVQYGAFKRLDCHPMSAGVENLVVETDEPVAVWVPENGVIPETALGLAPVGITAKQMGVILGISNQLLQDSDVDLGAYISLKFSRAIAGRADYTAYMADGSSDAGGLNGGFTGLFNSGTVVSAAAGHTTIGAMGLDDIINLVTSVPEAVLEANPAWFVNPLLLPQFLGIKDGNGRPIFLNALEAPAYGAIGTILGAPVYPVSRGPEQQHGGPARCGFRRSDGLCLRYPSRLSIRFLGSRSLHRRPACLPRPDARRVQGEKRGQHRRLQERGGISRATHFCISPVGSP